jgi:hypothetical protein
MSTRFPACGPGRFVDAVLVGRRFKDLAEDQSAEVLGVAWVQRLAVTLYAVEAYADVLGRPARVTRSTAANQ